MEHTYTHDVDELNQPDEVESNLIEWKREATGSSEKSSRKIAVRQILSAYRTDNTSLDLWALGFRTLPSSLGSLTNLKYLSITSN